MTLLLGVVVGSLVTSLVWWRGLSIGTLAARGRCWALVRVARQVVASCAESMENETCPADCPCCGDAQAALRAWEGGAGE